MKNDLSTKRFGFYRVIMHLSLSTALTIAMVSGLAMVDRLQSSNLVSSIHAIFRNDQMLGNTAAMGRRMADLESLNLIECVKLHSKSIGEIYATSFKSNCQPYRFHLNRLNQGTFASLSGEVISYEFRASHGVLFQISAVVVFLSLLISLNGALLWYWSVSDVKEKELNIYRGFAEQAEQVSHDIRSPLSALNMAVRLLPNAPDEIQKMISQATRRIDDIANDLLKKRSFERKSELSVSEKTFGNILGDVCREKALLLKESRRISIKEDFGNQDLPCSVDQADLSRVISNLLNNAIEALSDGGHITVGLRVNRQNQPTIMVSDDGPGIPEFLLEQLGKQKVNSTKTIGGSGSGVGIYYCQRTIEALGGTMSIQSRRGIGTMVTISFRS